MKNVIFLLAAALFAGCDSGSAAPPTPANANTNIPGTSQPSSQPTTQPTSRPTTKLTEKQKIEALIAHIENLADATFIRNEAEHNCREAAKHMRDKWQWKRKEIRTARDFITVAATKSSVSGRTYLIRFKDGREVKCGEYLLQQLKQLENPPPPACRSTSTPSNT